MRAFSAILARAAALGLVALVVGAGGCRPSLPSAYSCARNDQCTRSGVAGVCEMPAQACSFPDATCAGGRRYGELGPPPFAGSCVGSSGGVDLGSGSADLAGDAGSGKLIQRLGSTTVPSGDHATTVSVPALPGVAAGDLLFVVVYAADGAAAVTAPSGWVAHADLGGGVVTFRAGYFYRIAGASEPSSYAFTLAKTPSSSAALLLAYRNVAPPPPIDISTTQTFEATAMVAPSITTTRANDELVAMFVDGSGSGATLTAPSGMAAAAAARPIFAFDQLQALPGATGDKTPGGGLGGISLGAVDFVALAPAP